MTTSVEGRKRKERVGRGESSRRKRFLGMLRRKRVTRKYDREKPKEILRRDRDKYIPTPLVKVMCFIG